MKKKGAGKKQKQKNKNLIAIIVAIAAVVVAIVAALVIGLNLGLSDKINDEYFVSDGRKIVLSLNDEMSGFIDGEFEPGITHLVYYYSGDKINDVKIFFVYDDEEEAELAYDSIGDTYEEWASSKEINGKYLIFKTDSELYEDLSAERLRSDIESMKAVGGAL